VLAWYVFFKYRVAFPAHENSILLYLSFGCLHNTYLLQPLDVGVFRNLKYNFKKVVQKEIFNSVTDITWGCLSHGV
jgi:hypothetical protein